MNEIRSKHKKYYCKQTTSFKFRMYGLYSRFEKLSSDQLNRNFHKARHVLWGDSQSLKHIQLRRSKNTWVPAFQNLTWKN